MSSRSNLIRNRGLITNENELSVSEGSLRQATNVNVDEQGVVTPRRGFNDYGTLTGGTLNTSNIVKQIFEYKNRIFRHFASKLEFEDAEGNFNSIEGIYNELISGYRIKFQESRGNMYFTTTEGIKKISVRDNTQLTPSSTVDVTQSGVPRAAYIEATSQDSVGGFLSAQSKVGYRFLFGTKDNSNNLLLGSPSSRFVLSNINQDVIVNQDFTLDINSSTNTIQNGDYVLISTISEKYTFYFDVDGLATEPYDSNTVGTTFVKVDVSSLTLTDDDSIASFFANQIANNIAEYDTSVSSNQITSVSTEDGSIDANIIVVGNVGAITESSMTQGSITQGNEANGRVTVIIPTTVTPDYFIQVYRTNFITATTGLDLADIDPGDEHNLVFEVGLTQEDIDAGELTFVDSTPESFRASAVPLYTNEVTGQGILQSNDQPPIALDIDLFRNSVFYGNTKSTHRTEFTIISVDDYVLDSTKIVVGNSDISRYYTASNIETPDTQDGGDFRLSSSISVGQAIDETARSLVKIINQDSESPVNAFYLSGPDDLPGNILLEARNLTDNTFFIGIDNDEPNNPFIGEEFNPRLPSARELTSFKGLGATTEITLNDHGFVDGDEVYVSYNKENPSDPESFAGEYIVSNSDTNTFEINQATITSESFFPTNPTTVFSPEVESDNLEAPNRLYFSKTDLPEAVPAINFINVGAQDEPIRRILSLRDNLFVLKDDGVFIVSGTSAPNFTVRQTDSTKIIAPDSAVVLNNQIYCLTEQGISRINGSGQVGIISRGIENLIDRISNAKFDFVPNTFGVSYENDRAYILFMPTSNADNSSTQAYRYNIFENTWTRWEYNATCGLVLNRDSILYVGNGDRNYISQERKNFNRTDQSDRDFANSIVTGGVVGTTIRVGSTQELEVSDVITQTQEVSIYYLNNRLLNRMDEFDTGITPPMGSTMLETFRADSGDVLFDKFQALNDYLNSLDPFITNKLFTQVNLLEQVELLVSELNNSGSITNVKGYRNPESVTFEAYVTKVDRIQNIATLHSARPWLSGEITVYKHFPQIIEWNPQHFGDPSALKQVREVSIIFDQNNFYDARARFASDVSQDLTDINFQGKGLGYWGDMKWSAPNHYWGGNGNDIPFRTIVPREKQRCRYISLTFEHRNAREDFRILGITGVVRAISSRAYK